MNILDPKLKEVLNISLALFGKKRATYLLLTSFAIVLLDFLSVALLVPLLKFAQGDFFTPFSVFFWGTQASSKEILLLTIAFFLGFVFAKNIILFFAVKYKYSSLFFVQEKLSRLLLSKYLKKNFSEFRGLTFAKVSRNVVSETGHFVSTLINLVDIAIEILVFSSIFLLIGSRAVSLYFFLFFFAIVGFIVFSYTKKKMYSVGSIRVNSERERVSEVQGIYNLFKEIKIYGSESYFLSRYDRPNHQVAESHAIENTIKPLSKYSYEILTVTFIFFYVGSYFDTVLFYDNLILILAALFRLFPSFTKVITSLQQVAVHKKSVDGIIEIFRSGEFIESFKHSESQTGLVVNSFSYTLQNLIVGEKVIKNMSISLDEKDKMVLIRAESGFGKSLFLSCIVGLIDADGIYVINGTQMSENDVKKLELFSFNSQSAPLLNETIISNIVFDESNYELDSVKLKRSIEIAGLTPFIAGLSDGIYSTLSDRGHNLSGGQQQRVTLARTIFKNRPVMILDESLSALDKTGQFQILSSLKKDYPGKVIVVSHDPIDPELFDKIFTYE